MRKAIIVLVVVLILFFAVFQKVNVAVLNAENSSPVSYAEIAAGSGKYVADKNGKVSFFHSIFQDGITVNRIGFQKGTFKVPFSIVSTNDTVRLKQSDFTEIQKDLNTLLNSVSSYKYNYVLSSSTDGKTQMQRINSAFYKGNFEFSYDSDFTNAHYKVMYKNKQFYTFENGNWKELAGEEKNQFLNKNIVFISLSDLVSSIFPSSDPDSVECSFDRINFVWPNMHMEIMLSADGFISELTFESNTESQNIKIDLKVSDAGKRMSIPDE